MARSPSMARTVALSRCPISPHLSCACASRPPATSPCSRRCRWSASRAGRSPAPNQARDEKPYDYAAQNTFELNPSGLDTEGLVRTASGDFWLVDEYSPSPVHVDARRQVVQRFVPEGIALEGADYPVASKGQRSTANAKATAARRAGAQPRWPHALPGAPQLASEPQQGHRRRLAPDTHPGL